ncbi:pH-response transcription factor pacC/RIM101 [Erysiphe neolycopersici]|uniref:pH-response transcription factor pacC/RIM101 n=1 Tax=Erysiphe neolycopersici TaxID=212602 RepID=A0A420HZT2_9PEZI|nr:pH-response transcription factor pacC/RIM101 [Erysiphe neolycopersici]
MSASGPKNLQQSNATANSPNNRHPVAAVAAATDKSLVCQWDKCSERCVSAEALFNHICEKHVGRKSTNNLNLTCGWASCRTTTVKRDHITSHIRVHVPLKPHGCDFCGKAFKRPQDLKKHVKTHADDSVVIRSSEVNQNGITKVIDALNFRGSPSTYYKPNITIPGSHGQYSSAHNSVHGSYYTHQQNPYGSVYYPSTNGTENGHTSSYDNRKRSCETLNQFFGDAKRRQIDPNSYSQVGQRLLALHGLPIHSNGLSEYISNEPSLVSVDNQNGGNQVSVSTHQYALPLPNLRTKTDLMNVDKFLEQMQSTVYESSNATAGVHQPVAYPSLPAVSMGYQSHSSNTIPSSLGPIFDNDVRRRFSGGLLQRSSNRRGRNEELVSMDESSIESSNVKLNSVQSVNQNIDPALSDVNSPSEPMDNSESARDKAEEAWIENIRVIEALRHLVNERLRRKEYESDNEDVSMTGVCSKQAKEEEKLSRITYPILHTTDN